MELKAEGCAHLYKLTVSWLCKLTLSLLLDSYFNLHSLSGFCSTWCFVVGLCLHILCTSPAVFVCTVHSFTKYTHTHTHTHTHRGTHTHSQLFYGKHSFSRILFPHLMHMHCLLILYVRRCFTLHFSHLNFSVSLFLSLSLSLSLVFFLILFFNFSFFSAFPGAHSA